MDKDEDISPGEYGERKLGVSDHSWHSLSPPERECYHRIQIGWRRRCLRLWVGRGVVVIVIVSPEHAVSLCRLPLPPFLLPLLLQLFRLLHPRPLTLTRPVDLSYTPRPLLLLTSSFLLITSYVSSPSMLTFPCSSSSSSSAESKYGN